MQKPQSFLGPLISYISKAACGNENIKMPSFMTRKFMDELKKRTKANWDRLTEEEGIALPA